METGPISSNKGFQDIELFGNRIKYFIKLAVNEVEQKTVTVHFLAYLN